MYSPFLFITLTCYWEGVNPNSPGMKHAQQTDKNRLCYSNIGKKIQVYLSGWLYDRGLGPLLRSIRGWISASIRDKELYPVLDLCTGTGMMCRNLKAPPYQVLGLDLDDRMLQYARSKAPGIPFILGNAAQLPIMDGIFGSVIISFALHDKTEEVRNAMLQETRRVLRVGGRVFFVDFEKPWNRASRWGRIFTYSIERAAGGEHFRNSQSFLTQGGLRSFLSDQGWHEQENRSFAWGNSRVVVCPRPDHKVSVVKKIRPQYNKADIFI